MEAVEQKILLEQIFAAYRKTYDGKNKYQKSVDRDLKVLIMRVVEGKTLTEIGIEFGVQKERIRQIEAKTYRRIAYVLKRLKLKSMF
jgi:DNA-directed RNA polymerase sigma subunit (sigma70/sigma32)